MIYKAWDRSLERQVALKEYLPSSLAYRSGKTQVSVRSERMRDTFKAGLDSFVRESQVLAAFHHPSLVRVFRFFIANGTAYMVMPLYSGKTLKKYVDDLDQPPSEDWLIELLDTLTEVLRLLHHDGWYHRDIAPDNIMMVDGGTRPVLLDFGAARRVIGDMTQALTVILKPGYAPIEQYAAIANIKQGPWTDIYALAATMEWLITGKIPPVAAGRILQDTRVPLAVSEKGNYSDQFLCALDKALVVRPENRTPDIDRFRADLGLNLPLQILPLAESSAQVVEPTSTPTSTSTSTSTPTPILTGASLPLAVSHQRQGHRRLFQFAAVLSLLGLGTIAVIYLKSDRSDDIPKTVTISPAKDADQPPATSITSETASVPSPSPAASAPAVLTAPAVPIAPAVPVAPAATVAVERRPPPAPPLAANQLKRALKSADRTDSKAPSQRAQCANLMRQLSLGDDSPEIRAAMAANACAQ